MYLAGVSVRRVEDLPGALDFPCSASTVNNLNKKVYGRGRMAKCTSTNVFPCFADGIWLKRSGRRC